MNTEKKLVTTNIPKELPEIKVSSIDAKGFWETFEQTYAEKPNEITVLDKYALSDYPASEKNSVFVATDGDDAAGDGSIVKPFASIKRALQEVEGKDGAAIQVRGGSYKIDETICLTDKNSGQDGAPLFITAYGDEKVTMTTGISLSGDKFVRADKASFLTQKDIDRLKGKKQEEEAGWRKYVPFMSKKKQEDDTEQPKSKKDLFVVGLAKGKEEAHKVVTQIIDEVYRETGGFAVLSYLQTKKDSKNH